MAEQPRRTMSIEIQHGSPSCVEMPRISEVHKKHVYMTTPCKANTPRQGSLHKSFFDASTGTRAASGWAEEEPRGWGFGMYSLLLIERPRTSKNKYELKGFFHVFPQCWGPIWQANHKQGPFWPQNSRLPGANRTCRRGATGHSKVLGRGCRYHEVPPTFLRWKKHSMQTAANKTKSLKRKGLHVLTKRKDYKGGHGSLWSYSYSMFISTSWCTYPPKTAREMLLES